MSKTTQVRTGAFSKFPTQNGDRSTVPDNSVGTDAIADLAVTESKLSSANADGLHAHRLARATYDFAADGGLTGNIGLGVTIPDNAIVVRAFIDIITNMASAGGNGTIAINVESAGDILVAVDADTISGIVDGIPDHTAANSIKTTSTKVITATIGTEDLTAGKFIVFVEYVLSE